MRPRSQLCMRFPMLFFLGLQARVAPKVWPAQLGWGLDFPSYHIETLAAQRGHHLWAKRVP